MADGRPSEHVRPMEGWIALGYFSAYLAYQLWRPEGELLHWLSLVAIPFVLALALRYRDPRPVASAAASVGLRRGNLRTGLGWALGLGLAITAFQVLWGGRSDAIQEMVRSGRALWLLPLSFVLMVALAGFTEEFFFRGFVQTRMERLVRSRWLAVGVTTLLFGLYHLPYAYLNPRWPSYGDWGRAWAAAMGEGIPGGLLLGAVYVFSRGNLLACVLLHALINTAPAMTMIRFGGG